MPDLSDTDLHLNFEFEEDLVLEGFLNRIHAPLIVEEIKSLLPIKGRTALMRTEMQITLGISKGYAKPTNDVKKGDKIVTSGGIHGTIAGLDEKT